MFRCSLSVSLVTGAWAGGWRLMLPDATMIPVQVFEIVAVFCVEQTEGHDPVTMKDLTGGGAARRSWHQENTLEPRVPSDFEINFNNEMTLLTSPEIILFLVLPLLMRIYLHVSVSCHVEFLIFGV